MQLIHEVETGAVVIGRGIPLFAPGDFDLRLQLLEAQTIAERIVQLRCAVDGAAGYRTV